MFTARTAEREWMVKRMSDMTIQNAIHCMKAIICEEVCEECDYYGKTGTDHCEADAVRMAIKALEEQPHWIPCSERLPERGTSILMSSRQGWVAEGEYKGVLDGCHLWIEYRWSASLTNGEIIAWMPLPKPYGGE